jgi:hypothetical protein
VFNLGINSLGTTHTGPFRKEVSKKSRILLEKKLLKRDRLLALKGVRDK